MNYIALKGQMGRRLAFWEQEGIVTLHWNMKKEIDDRFPLFDGCRRRHFGENDCNQPGGKDKRLFEE